MGKQSKILFLLCVMILALLAGGYFVITMTEEKAEPISKQEKKEEEKEKNKEEEKEVIIPESKNGLMIGFDQSNKLTDVLMVGHVDTKQNAIKVISIPRDFYIDFSKEPFRSIKKANPNNRIGHCKINEIYINMGATEDGLDTLKQVIEVITGLEIDYMATINVNGFKEVVDIVGGVEFDVPERMYKVDPYQNPPLRIDLKPGLQVLNGEMAQGLVRYRGYKLGDLQRIKVQQEFVKALFQKVASSNSEQMTQLIRQIFSMFRADFGIVEVMDYFNYFLDKDLVHLMSTANMTTLEGYFGDVNGISILNFDIAHNQEIVKALLEKDPNQVEEPKEDGQTENETVENKEKNK